MQPGVHDDYIAEMTEGRREKDIFFRDDPDSPIPRSLRQFSGLAYFPVDPSWRVAANLVKYPRAEPIVLATSKGIPRKMLRYGYFEFEVGGQKVRLDAFKSADNPRDTSLFVPFRDATSGKESYGAARYLDLEEGRSGQYALDFNLAYNPYCAYSPDYVCPLPPRENWLTIAVTAGEKDFPLGH